MDSTETEFHSIRALSLMIKLALFEQRYYEASILMHERTTRIGRWGHQDGEDFKNLVYQTMLDTTGLQQVIDEHIKSVQGNFNVFVEGAEARKAYSLSQFMANGSNYSSMIKE